MGLLLTARTMYMHVQCCTKCLKPKPDLGVSMKMSNHHSALACLDTRGFQDTNLL